MIFCLVILQCLVIFWHEKENLKYRGNVNSSLTFAVDGRREAYELSIIGSKFMNELLEICFQFQVHPKPRPG